MRADRRDLRDDHYIVDAYTDLLTSLEMAIQGVAYPDVDVSDGQVELALERLVRHYEAEAAGREPQTGPLREKTGKIFDATRSAADAILAGGAEVADATARDIDHAVLIACLKRIRKSVRFWNKQAGRRGDITYVNQFLRNEPDA